MAQSWDSHDILRDTAVTVLYSISEYEAASQAYQDRITAYTAAIASDTAAKAVVDAQLAIWLAVPGRPA